MKNCVRLKKIKHRVKNEWILNECRLNTKIRDQLRKKCVEIISAKENK